MTILDDIRNLEEQHVLGTYKRQPVVFVRGDGAYLIDSDGKKYLDFLSGIGVAARGHGDQDLTEAIRDQAATLIQVSNLYYHPLQGQAAQLLTSLSGLDRVFFCNSGAEAVEACLKFSRRYWYTQGQTERREFVALEGAFSGRTFGALSVTHDHHYRDPFAPLVPGVTFVDPKDPAALHSAVTERTAAIIAEPIQGEGVIRPLTKDFASAIKEACNRTGALFIADEVQTGVGRTGYPFYFQALDLHPDLVSVGKALGGGIPVGATICSSKVANHISPGDHGSTYGGNLLACRAAIVILTALADGDLLDQIKSVGMHFERCLRSLALRHPCVTEIRGAGLMRGVQLRVDATSVVDAAREQGLLVNRTDEKVLRMLPPLTINKTDIDCAVDILDKIFDQIDAESSE